MKKAISLFLILTLQSIHGQPDKIVKQKLDSILSKVESEKDGYKRMYHMLRMFSIRLEEYPYLVMYSHQKVYTISQDQDDPVMEAFAWGLAGHSYRLSGNYIKGLEYHHKAVALAEKTGNQNVLSFTRTVMGHLYKDREEYRKAIKLYLAAYKMEPVGENERILKYWLNGNLSTVYLETRQLDSCLYYVKQTNLEKEGSKINFLTDRSTAGAYSLLGKSAEAEKIYHKDVRLLKDKNSNRMLNMVYVSLAEHFQRNRNMDSAIYYSRKSIDVIHNSSYHYLAMKPAKLLTDIYQETNADSTIKYLKIFRAANDSLYSTQANQQLQMMTIEEDMRQRKLASEKVEYQNKTRMNLMLGGLGTLFLIGIILYYNNRQKQKANKALQSAMNELKTTQSQLIQSEKMASLGELTAGIAHEIQNPLNFVNNFSDVSIELITEIEEERAKNQEPRQDELVDEILGDIKQNLEKISHHGNRADAIVKGMLQHSRASSGQKEPTDVNALADEYLRLAYHGLRAKDKSFNAELITDFEPHLPKVDAVPQDIGRVLLNLLTNAFYATHKRSQQEVNFKPFVALSTSVDGKSVQITVKDNGGGIPPEIVDKIFQPFFTTKPTGEGTGLGLSLAYDIITKAHGGELTVSSTPGEGTAFTIQLKKS